MRAILFVFLLATAEAQVRTSDIATGAGQNWLTYAGTYQGSSVSSLKDITPENVSNLVPKWTFRVPKADGLRTRPIVYNGVMYITNTNEMYALDARSGRVVWHYVDLKSKKKEGVNRGSAILGDKVYFVTADIHLVALDRRTGGLVWRKQYGEIEKGMFASCAPLAAETKIIVGVAGGDTGMRGYVAALDAETGEEKWRTYTVPAPGEKGSESWGKTIDYGGGATWLSGTYDPELKTLYWPTGNPWPDFYAGDRKGDNLYTCSVVALDVDTGQMKWYFQFTPGDTHDWDAQSWPMLVDLPYQGKTRKLMLHANRNGFLYVLDRTTGEYLRSSKLVNLLDWASGIDPKGRPIVVPDKEPTPAGTRVCPGVQGATNWMSQAFLPTTKWLYLATLEQCDIFTSSSKDPVPNAGFSGGGAGPKPKDRGQFFLRAYDPLTGERKWEYPMTGPGTMWGGTIGTVTGVIFTADDDGHLIAVDAKEGKHLWHYQMGEPLNASPIIYSVDGKEYVAVAASTAIFSFGLFEPVKSIPVPVTKIQ
jgi:alcohol dehydrogenase (cytochrome c)